MENTSFDLVSLGNKKEEKERLLSCIRQTGQRYGLTLTDEETRALMAKRDDSLKKYHRVEFGRGMLDKLVYTFCDSQYIQQETYGEVLGRLQDIFYRFKNEALDRLSDDELLSFMKEQFENVCFGDLDYLEGTCLERFSRAIRAGYEGFRKSGGKEEYSQFDEEKRWDGELYQQVLKELFWE
ncbi:MAG: DUF6323 family protein [Blautia sp.]